MDVCVTVVLIGGPYDGQPGLYAIVEENLQGLPSSLLIGVCPGDGCCNGRWDQGACGEKITAAHVGWWDGAGSAPVPTVKYGLIGAANPDHKSPAAKYLHADLDLSAVLEEDVLVPAGAGV